MTKKTNNTPKHFPSLALLFATGRAQAVNDSIMLDDEEAARHAVSGIENISYGYGEDGEGIDLMQNFAAISNPVDGTWVVVARPRDLGVMRKRDPEDNLVYVGGAHETMPGTAIRLLAPKI